MTSTSSQGVQEKLRVAVVQFAPKLGQVDYNVKKATEICSKIQPNSVDLVCLPEMILTGYKFRDAEAISPFLELPQEGVTSRFCQDLARRLRSCVIAGYPEKKVNGIPGTSDDDSSSVGYNSAVIFGKDGTFMNNYRKVNMFEMDKTWAQPGDGFMTLVMPSFPQQYQTTSVAICMDLNPLPPVEWTLRTGPYELADYCRSSERKERTKLLILLNAWLDSHDNEDSKWDVGTLNYWCARLRPLWDVEHAREPGSESEGAETVVIVCNRCGVDDDAVFAGTSAVLRLREGSGQPEVVGVMSRYDEGFKIYHI